VRKEITLTLFNRIKEVKLLYIAFCELSSVGVLRKISSQCNALVKNGVDVKLCIISNKRPMGNLTELAFPSNLFFPEKEMGRYSRRKWKLDTLNKLLQSIEDDRVIYLRYPNIADLRMSKIVKNSTKYFFTEHQTIEVLELISKRAVVSVMLEMFYGRILRRYITGFVTVTKEICDYEVKRSGDPKKPCLVNGNGIDVSSVPLRTSPAFDGKHLELLCVAQVAKWHGLDRFIKGMAKYSGDVNIKLHIVGDGSEVPNLKRLVSELKLENAVLFHGFKTGKELDKLFDKCHIAVGSLGNHRKGLTETSELKAREYCARGIPFFCSANDADFPNDFPYILKVPADENPIEIPSVVEFARKVLLDQEHSEKMRRYAEENLDWSIKMKRLIEFMQKILQKKGKNEENNINRSSFAIYQRSGSRRTIKST